MGAVVFKDASAKIQEPGDTGTSFTNSVWAPVNERKRLNWALQGSRDLLADRSKGTGKGHSGN